MKPVIVLVLLFGLFVFPLSTTLAAPFKANNPQVVANYQTGDHGVVGELFLHQGADVVKQNGNSGNFQQWFFGTTEEPGVTAEGDHSVWKLSKDGTCPANFDLVPNANQSWGGYLQAGNYCVRTNNFNSH